MNADLRCPGVNITLTFDDVLSSSTQTAQIVPLSDFYITLYRSEETTTTSRLHLRTMNELAL
jgi:hypothetical protein